MRKILTAILLAISLSACTLFQSFQNPITPNQLAVIESGYGIALSIAVGYRNLRLCKRNEVPTISNVCALRAVILKLQAADRKAQLALRQARAFIRNNPTLDAFTVLRAAQEAVDAFKLIEAENGLVK